MVDYITPKVTALATKMGDDMQALEASLETKADLVNGKVPSSQLPSASAGPKGVSTLVFSMPGEVHTTAGGVPHVLPFSATVEKVTAALSKAPTTVPIEIDLSINGAPAWANPDDRPVVQPGNRVGTIATPNNIGSYPPGTPIVASVVGADSAPSGETLGPPIVSSIATYNSLDALVASAAIPKPPDLAEGNLWFAWVTAGVRVTGIPVGWTELAYAHDIAPSLHGHLLFKVAAQVESASQMVTPSANGPVAITSFCVTNGGVREGLATNYQDTSSASFASPVLTTTDLDRLGIWMFSTRLTTGAQATSTVTGGATEISDLCTTRPTTVNVTNVVATAPIPEPGSTEAVTVTTSGPTGRQIAVVLAVAPASVEVRSPGEDLNVYVTIREVN